MCNKSDEKERSLFQILYVAFVYLSDDTDNIRSLQNIPTHILVQSGVTDIMGSGVVLRHNFSIDKKGHDVAR